MAIGELVEGKRYILKGGATGLLQKIYAVQVEDKSSGVWVSGQVAQFRIEDEADDLADGKTAIVSFCDIEKPA